MNKIEFLKRVEKAKEICFHITTVPDRSNRLKTQWKDTKSKDLSWNFITSPLKNNTNDLFSSKSIRFRLYGRSFSNIGCCRGEFNINIDEVVKRKEKELEKTISFEDKIKTSYCIARKYICVL